MSLKTILLRTQHHRNKFISLTATTVRRKYEQWNQKERAEQHRNFKRAVGAALFSSILVAKSLKESHPEPTVNVASESAPTEENINLPFGMPMLSLNFQPGSLTQDEQEKYKIDKVSNKKGKGGMGGDGGNIEAGEKRPDLPVYTAEEVSKHDSPDDFWVTYKYGVYDVTAFLPSHPGGEQILNAGGHSIEPFWNVYGMHKTKAVYELLESYRIGNLRDEDVVDHSEDELWAHEPVRDRRLIVKTKQPFNAEIPAKLIIQSLDTPNEIFFVRQHMPVPELEDDDHKVEIVIKNGKTSTKVFSLEELAKTFPAVEVRAALMCAGNRRTEMSKVRAVRGLAWRAGAVGCARWRGALLRDVLLHCGLDPARAHGLHVVFTGLDIDATGEYFSTSIPLEMALNPNGRIVLATHMNGEVLPKDHGYPLRVIVPGAPAVRSVKWLKSITISKEESPSHWHQKDYRSFNSSETWETADFASAPPLYSMPVTSAICDPADGDECDVSDGTVEVRGYAYSGGGARVVRVDVSADGGRSWRAAHELLADDAPAPRHYSWTLWAARVPVPQGATQVEIWAKATDSNFNAQPESFEHIWNIRGNMSNAYHKIKVKLRT